MSTNFCWPLHTCCTGGAWTFQVNNRCFIEEQTHSNESSVVQVVPTTSCSKQSCPTCVKYARTHILGWFVHASITKVNYLNIRAFRTDARLWLLTKIDFNVMHLVSLCKKIWRKLQIRGSRDLQNSLLYPASILALQLQGIQIWIFRNVFSSIGKFSQPNTNKGIFAG